MLKNIYSFVFGQKTQHIETIQEGYHTVQACTKLDFQTWCNEFKLGILSSKNEGENVRLKDAYLKSVKKKVK